MIGVVLLAEHHFRKSAADRKGQDHAERYYHIGLYGV